MVSFFNEKKKKIGESAKQTFATNGFYFTYRQILIH